jgi:hypothetical protein
VLRDHHDRNPGSPSASQRGRPGEQEPAGLAGAIALEEPHGDMRVEAVGRRPRLVVQWSMDGCTRIVEVGGAAQGVRGTARKYCSATFLRLATDTPHDVAGGAGAGLKRALHVAKESR